MSFATLGPITFEVNADLIRTWRDARRSGSGRWHLHEVYGGKPKLEFLGPGIDSIKMSVHLDIERGLVPRDELRQMRKQRDTGAVLQFAIGGDLVGDFVLKDVDEEWSRVNNTGVLMKAIAGLSLEEYV